MPRRIIAAYLPAVSFSVAATQTFSANTPLVLQSARVFNGIYNSGNFIRKINLVSTSDLSAINFVIVGYDGTSLTGETIAGPNAGTVTTTKSYLSIVSITPSADSGEATINLGLAAGGATPWLEVDNTIPYFNTTIQCSATATISYTIDSTCTELYTPSYTGGTVNTPVVRAVQTAQTTSTTVNTSNVASAYRITVGSSSGGGSLSVVILQQGLR